MKDYKKILKGVINIINTTEKSDIGFVNICTYIGENCLELKENEDEKIRKWIINEIKVKHHNLDEDDVDFVDKAIAWLEKQGEIDKTYYEIAEKEKYDFVSGQYIECRKSFDIFKEDNSYWFEYIGNDNYIGRSDNILNQKFHITPKQLYCLFTQQHCPKENKENEETDKQNYNVNIKPKFKIGDWITNNGHSYLIGAIADNKYLFEIGGYTHEKLNWEYIENADKYYHLWTIEDAKDGDVLVYGDNPNDHHVKVIMIFKSFRNIQSVFTHFHIFDNMFRVDDWCDCGKNVHPATKEERKLLFQQMKETGYDWDSRNKKIIKL